MLNKLWKRGGSLTEVSASKIGLVIELMITIPIMILRLTTSVMAWLFLLSFLVSGSIVTILAGYAANNFFEGGYWVGTPEGMISLLTLALVSFCVLLAGMFILIVAEQKKPT